MAPRSISWPSPAKLNLFLYITGRRPDGYHELQTLFQLLDYGDKLHFTLRKDNKIQLLTPMDAVAHETNLILRAASLLQQYCHQQNSVQHIPLGADIAIEKLLPIGGGLGGGAHPMLQRH